MSYSSFISVCLVSYLSVYHQRYIKGFHGNCPYTMDRSLYIYNICDSRAQKCNTCFIKTFTTNVARTHVQLYPSTIHYFMFSDVKDSRAYKLKTEGFIQSL